MRLESFFKKTAFLTVAVAACGVLLPNTSSAFPLGEFYRGVRAMGMGNAFTAVANDEDSVFYNPAGLAFNQSVKMNVFNPKLGVGADPINDLADFEAISSDGISAQNVSKLFGKHFSADASIFPSIYLPNFVIGYYLGTSFDVIARNLSLPTINAQYYLDRGIVSGFGFEVGGFGKGHFLRFGLAGKWIQRTGYRGNIPITTLITFDRDYLESLKTGPASGFGLTPGVQYELPISRTNEIIFGSAWQDIGDTRFGSRVSSNRPPPIVNNLSAGFVFIQRFGMLSNASNIKFAAEGRHLAQSDIDPRLRIHSGLELEVANIALQAGVNQDSLTAGASIDLGIFKAAVATYGVEHQALAFMDRERKYLLQVSLRFDLLGKDARTLRDEERRKKPRLNK